MKTVRVRVVNGALYYRNILLNRECCSFAMIRFGLKSNCTVIAKIDPDSNYTLRYDCGITINGEILVLTMSREEEDRLVRSVFGDKLFGQLITTGINVTLRIK